MLKKPKSWTFWVVIVALNLVPIAAFGGKADPKAAAKAKAAAEAKAKAEAQAKAEAEAKAAAESAKQPPADLSFEEAKNTFPGFKVNLTDPEARDGKAYLDGALFLDCVQAPGAHFSIEPNLSGDSLEFTIKDPGRVVSTCQADHATKKDACLPNNCTDLRSFKGGEIGLDRDQDTKIHYGWKGALENGSFDHVADTGMVHRGRLWQQAEAVKKDNDKYTDYFTQAAVCDESGKKCEATPENAKAARSALKALRAAGKISADDLKTCNKRLDKVDLENRKKEGNEKLKAIEKEIATAKANQIDDILEELRSLSNDHPELNNNIAGLYEQLAKIAKKDGSYAGNMKAVDLITEAKLLDNLGAAVDERLQGDLYGFGADACMSLSRSTSPFERAQAGGCMQSVNFNMQNQIAVACSFGSNPDSCASAQRVASYYQGGGLQMPNASYMGGAGGGLPGTLGPVAFNGGGAYAGGQFGMPMTPVNPMIGGTLTPAWAGGYYGR